MRANIPFGGGRSPLTLGAIVMTIGTTSRLWRYVFISAEALVVCTYVVVGCADLLFDMQVDIESSPVAVSLLVAVGTAWLFLLLVSPFFLRSLRGLALAGWAIGVSLLIIGVLTPAR